MSAFNSAAGEYASREARLLEGYRRAPGVFDELRTEAGAVRDRWQPVLDAFAAMGGEATQLAQDKAQRLLLENGVTFVAPGEREHGGGRPWRLDLFPQLIAPGEWSEIERAVIQRARLLNDLLVDLYGAQRSLKEKVVPPGLVFGNPQFLRPCTSVAVRDNRHLHFIAFDLGRSADGRWWVLSDRTQAPSGAGYALENRVVSSQCLPELFGERNVRRLASFFRAFTEHFLSLSSRDQPLAVYLSPGPSQQNYFEHAYLARYLGFSAVEGSDLTVRDDRVYLKTVEGLKPVDLIMRRISAELCDPLELRTDSLIGVPGLLQAARAGKVTIGNALGSGLVETDAFLSFLPSLARFFLSEELAMPSVATWWCGQAREREYVLSHLDELVVRRISTPRTLFATGQSSLVGPDTTPEQRDRLIHEIERSGYDFVGQEPAALSTAPMWAGANALEAAPITLRVYVAATAKGYEVMPGGLTRLALGADRRAPWLEAGDVSKDTWVLSDQPVEQFSLLAQRQANQRLHRGGRDLPSRTADSLFWLGRYTERAEVAVRLFRSLVIRLGGEMGSTRNLVSPERVVSMLIVQKHLSARRGRRAMQEGREAVEQELWTILFDPECRDGLSTVLGNVRRNAEAVRERLSFDTFRILRDLTEVIHSWELSPGHETDDALRLLNRLIQYLAAFNGMVMENMTRGYGWRFLDMGRRLERLRAMIQSIQQLAVRGEPQDDGALELLLELADSTMTYRGRYQAAPQLPAVLDLLLSDEANPRSAMFQIVSLADHIAALPNAGEDGLLTPDQRLVTRLGNELRLADPVELGAAVSRFDSRVELDRLARRIDRDVHQLSDHIAERFFSHSSARRVAGARRVETQ
ncbi:MAG TPA: circularly permuted type 2 ATP-grasp protein [Gammaproteobacteria bacterium]|nr:circularly permuted type 2 ATP-grasp protein [Gammaproteobacteria bacterium]